MPQNIELVAALRRITQSLDNHSKFLEAQTGLTLSQVLVLQALALSSAPVSAGKLAGRVSLSQGTLTAILDRLEARGLLRRLRGEPDRRRVMVALTEQGRAVAERAPSALPEHFELAFARLAATEAALLLDALHAVAALMQRPDDAQRERGEAPVERAGAALSFQSKDIENSCADLRVS